MRTSGDGHIILVYFLLLQRAEKVPLFNFPPIYYRGPTTMPFIYYYYKKRFTVYLILFSSYSPLPQWCIFSVDIATKTIIMHKIQKFSFNKILRHLKYTYIFVSFVILLYNIYNLHTIYRRSLFSFHLD